jgi:hypothetical protein
MGETSAAIAATEAKVASVLTVQPAMASNAAPPGLENAAGNVPTPFPFSTSARKPADLSAEIAGSIKEIAGADKKIAVATKTIAIRKPKMEGAGAKMEIGRAKPARARVLIAVLPAESIGVGAGLAFATI